MPSDIKTARLGGLPTEMRRALAEARQARGWSQAELGKRVGLPQAHVSLIESGKTSPRFNTLLDLVRVLDHDLILTPRPLVPSVRALIRDYRSPDTREADDGELPLYAGPENPEDDDES